jgi:hypothetical protein
MTKKQGNALPAGIYKVFWKRGGWSWAAISCMTCDVATRDGLKGRPINCDRQIMAMNWSGQISGRRMWRKIAKVERAPLAKMEGER